MLRGYSPFVSGSINLQLISRMVVIMFIDAHTHKYISWTLLYKRKLTIQNWNQGLGVQHFGCALLENMEHTIGTLVLSLWNPVEMQETSSCRGEQQQHEQEAGDVPLDKALWLNHRQCNSVVATLNTVPVLKSRWHNRYMPGYMVHSPSPTSWPYLQILCSILLRTPWNASWLIHCIVTSYPN